MREFENFVGSRFTPACNTSHLRGQASRERQRIRKHRSESVAQKRHVYALNRAYALQLARTHTHVPRLRARSSVTNARRSPFPLSHLGDRRVTAHGAFTYTHAPHRRVFAHTRGAVRVRTYLRVRTRRCVLAGNRQTSWLEWGRGGGGNGSTRRRRHDAMPVPRAGRCSRMPRVVPASSCAATSPGRPSQHNQSTAKL